MSAALDMTPWTAVVLAGGLGTRLRQVCPETPKPLVPVLGRPFLDWVLIYLRACGFPRAVISTGDRSRQFSAYNGGERFPGLELTTVAEAEQLGTAGGFYHAAATAKLKNNLLCVNGDSLTLSPLQPMLEDFACNTADAALVAVRVEDAARYGTLDLDRDGCVRGFREKQPGAGWVNAGMYLLRAPLLGQFPRRRPLSFEVDMFPQLIAAGHAIRGYACTAPFLDIGIPEALAQAPAFLTAYFETFLRQAQS